VCEEPSDEEINAAVRDAVGYRPYFAFGERQRLQWISPVAPAAPDGTTCDVVRERMRELQELERRAAAGETALTGVPTGVNALDAKLGGYQLEILTIVGGRTRMGKSSLLLAALNACSQQGIGVHEFSLEDSRSSHADRTLGAVGSVPVADLRALKLRREGFGRLMNKAGSSSVREPR
jgi:replicative DNA helicase